jgi:hypothetical protein
VYVGIKDRKTIRGGEGKIVQFKVMYEGEMVHGSAAFQWTNSKTLQMNVASAYKHLTGQDKKVLSGLERLMVYSLRDKKNVWITTAEIRAIQSSCGGQLQGYTSAR